MAVTPSWKLRLVLSAKLLNPSTVRFLRNISPKLDESLSRLARVNHY
jgi:hypothetical protein